MRNILKESYIPFGSQYYRAPSPSRNEWENDLKNMADNGLRKRSAISTLKNGGAASS